MELCEYVNVPYDRRAFDKDGKPLTGSDGLPLWIPGESMADTAERIERIIGQPPPPLPPRTPPELRDPDAPPGWYDGPDMTQTWGPIATQRGKPVLT